MKKIKYVFLLLLMVLPINVFADMAAPVTSPLDNIGKYIPLLILLILSFAFFVAAITVTVIVVVKYGKNKNNIDKK